MTPIDKRDIHHVVDRCIDEDGIIDWKEVKKRLIPVNEKYAGQAERGQRVSVETRNMAREYIKELGFVQLSNGPLGQRKRYFHNPNHKGWDNRGDGPYALPTENSGELHPAVEAFLKKHGSEW